MKKILALILTAALLAMALALPSFGAYTDTEGHWAKENIDRATELGYFKGSGDGRFDPNANMTRAMFVTTLGRLTEASGLYEVPATDTAAFDDVIAAAYYAPYVAWAKANGIVNGTSETTFSPNATITREQIATILLRFLRDFVKADLSAYSTDSSAFTDADTISGYAKEAVGLCATAGLVNGMPNSDGTYRFEPKGVANRAQIATILVRMHDSFFGKTEDDPAPIDPGPISGGTIVNPDPSNPIPVDPPVTPPSQPESHTDEEKAAETQLVSDLQGILDAYNGSAIQYQLNKANDEDISKFFAQIVVCVEDALAKHENGQFLDEAFIRSTYAGQIAIAKEIYNGFSADQKKTAQNLALNFPNITRVLNYFGYTV